MIKIISICHQIADCLQGNSQIIDYRIALRGNENLYVYIIADSLNLDFQTGIDNAINYIYNGDVQIEYLHNDEVSDDSFYSQLFNSKEKVILDFGKRRLDYNFDRQRKIKHSSKIITFYSYKGGMGRSTTLASLALYLAIHHRKKVFIIDCDVEAPGLTNFFLHENGENNEQNGLLEYIFDKKSSLSEKSDLFRYSREVDKSITGNGEIRIMHAGNMNFGNDDNNQTIQDLTHYIHALSRLDLNTPDYASALLGNVILDIESEFNPEIILIDSRTGINDVFGLAITYLSDFVVGLFRNDIQTLPGLKYFIDSINANNLLANTFFVNSILPARRSEKEKLLNDFRHNLNFISSCDTDEMIANDIYPIQRDETLEVLGSANENLQDFYHLIKDKEFKDYNNLFEAIVKKLHDVPDNEKFLHDDQFTDSEISEIDDTRISNTEIFSDLNIDSINKLTDEERINLTKSIRSAILNLFSENIEKIDLYAENINSVLDDYKSGKFYFRDCMKDLFNLDKYIILGSKGTGKSYLYGALKERTIVEKLREFAKIDGNFYFLEAINKNNQIYTVGKIDAQNPSEEEKYRFWIIYTWQVLYKWLTTQFFNEIDSANSEKGTINLNQSLIFQNFGDNTSTSEWIQLKIQDIEFVKKIEDQYAILDNYLKLNYPDYIITILYDQLDEMVDPEIWDRWIPSLIRVWRSKRFGHIFGKMFLRKDLFNKLIGLTNKNDIRNQAIDIEWSKEEIYSFLIQTIFRPDGFNALWKIMYLYSKDNKTIVKQCRQKQSKIKLPILDDYYLRPQIETLFGKYIRTKEVNFNQESYDWFYSNLKNADNTISLRPFISLLQYALRNWKNYKYLNEENLYPVLYQQYYFEPEVRKNAVHDYYTDLVENEKGNMPIKYVFDYIGDSGLRYKRISFRTYLFEELLRNVIKQFSDKEVMKDMTVEKLTLLLESTGIVSKDNFGRGMVYKFSFLYKYMLGLKGS